MASRNRLKQTSLNLFFNAQSRSRNVPSVVDTKSPSPISIESDDEEAIAPRVRKRKRLIQTTEEEEEAEEAVIGGSVSSEDEEQAFTSPYRRRQMMVKRKVMISDDEDNEADRIQEDSDEEDDNEDLDFLGDNDVYEKRTRARKESQYRLALQRLRDRRPRSFNGSEGPMDGYAGGEAASQLTEEEEEEEEEEEAFVVDDDIVDGVKVERTAQVELPAAFSTAQTRRFSANFKVYVEFLVLQTAGQATQSPYYQTAVHGVERRVRGYQDSLLTSDAWRPEFKAALDRYPRWSQGRCRGLTCEGCRQNRAAGSDVVLAAEPEATEAEPRDKRFSLGSECYKRAKVYHRLVHFRSHMHKHVRNEAEALMTSACLTEDIMKAMQASGFVKQLYRQTQTLFNQARVQYMPAKGMPVDDASSDEEGE